MNQLTDGKSLETAEPRSDATAYEIDFVLWAERQAHLLRHGRIAELDRENLIEELEDMAGSQRRELRSRLIVLLIHLLKCQYQPGRKSTSWLATLGEQRSQIGFLLEDSPSLAAHLVAYADQGYPSAVTRAAHETGLDQTVFPLVNPYTQEQMLDLNFIP